MVRVVAGQTTTADAVMQRSATLSGTVKNTAGAALAGMTVTARLDGSAQDQLTTTSAADGSWAFTGLDVGGGPPLLPELQRPLRRLPAAGLRRRPVDAGTAGHGQSGRRRDDHRERGHATLLHAQRRRHRQPYRLPVAGLEVEPVLAPGQPPETQAYATSGGVTDATGAYTITGVPDGVYVLACNGRPPVYGMQYWPAAPTAAAGDADHADAVGADRRGRRRPAPRRHAAGHGGAQQRQDAHAEHGERSSSASPTPTATRPR